MRRARNLILSLLVTYNGLAVLLNAYGKYINPMFMADVHFDWRAETIQGGMINLFLLALLVCTLPRPSVPDKFTPTIDTLTPNGPPSQIEPA